MKISVQAELSDEEIRDLVADAARRGLVYGLQYIGQHVGDSMENIFGGISPQTSGQIASVLQQIMAQQAARAQSGPRQAPGSRSQFSVKFHPGTQQQPLPGGFDPGYAPPPGARVVPMAGSGAEIKECFAIEETPRNEASWGCCRCASPNGLQRIDCRTCGHTRCGAVSQVPGATGVAYPPNGPAKDPSP